MSTPQQTCTSCTQGSKDGKASMVNGAFECPLRMSDGRSFGDTLYGSRCDSQYQLQFDQGINSSFDYKQFLMQNAESLMQQNAQKAFMSTKG